MDLQWLDDVLVLLEEGNMTRAAARRNITQPAFSRRIRGFETWLGTQVLQRGSNAVSIHDALSANEPEIRALVSRIRDLKSRIASFDPADSVISVAAQHAPAFSVFPEMALHANKHLPAMKFRLRPGNLGDCVTMFLRNDASILLCYESDAARPMPFGDSVRHEIWGSDFLVPVVGGPLRHLVREDGSVDKDTPAIVYPEDSYFGEVLTVSDRAFSTTTRCTNPVCETALSGAIRELVLTGSGIGWLPYSMMYREFETGDAVSLASHYGREHLRVVLYADFVNEPANALLDAWSGRNF